jgi:hypothetical protein
MKVLYACLSFNLYVTASFVHCRVGVPTARREVRGVGGGMRWKGVEEVAPSPLRMSKPFARRRNRRVCISDVQTGEGEGVSEGPGSRRPA